MFATILFCFIAIDDNHFKVADSVHQVAKDARENESLTTAQRRESAMSAIENASEELDNEEITIDFTVKDVEKSVGGYKISLESDWKDEDGEEYKVRRPAQYYMTMTDSEAEGISVGDTLRIEGRVKIDTSRREFVNWNVDRRRARDFVVYWVQVKYDDDHLTYMNVRIKNPDFEFIERETDR